MTTIEQIKAEVEQLKIQEPRSAEADGYNMAIADLLSIIEEKSEKPMQEELEEEINRYLEPIHTADIQFVPFTQMTKCARHFAQWGAEHLKK